MLFFSGVLRIYRHFKLRNKLVVLMYHRVLTNTEITQSLSNAGIIVDRDTFDAHIDYLKKHFTILSIDQLVDHVKHQLPFKKPTCLITFDDGWIDNYTNALPILEKHKAPALIFLPINYIGTGNLFWQERIASYVYQIAQGSGTDRQFLVDYHAIPAINITPDALKNSIFQYIASLKKRSNSEIDDLLSMYKKHAKGMATQPTNTIDRYIDWTQVQSMSNRGISFGSHAVSHRLLTKMSEAAASQELTESKKVIESRLGKTIESIAYPNGDFNDAVINVAKNSGYMVGFSTIRGYFSPADKPYRIKRINMHQQATSTIPLFVCRILGIF